MGERKSPRLLYICIIILYVICPAFLMKTCLFILTFHHIFVKSFSYYFGREMYLFRIIQISHLIKNISFFQILSILTCFCIKSIRMNTFLCIRTFLISRTARKSSGLWNIIINAKSHTLHQAINKLIRILIISFFLVIFSKVP